MRTFSASLAALCLVVGAATDARAQPVPSIDHNTLVRYVTEVLTYRAPGRVEKWMRNFTYAVSAGRNTGAYLLWNSPFIAACNDLHIKCEGFGAERIDDADIQVYVVDDMVPTLLKFKSLLNRDPGNHLSDDQYVTWAKHINETSNKNNEDFITYLSNDTSLQKVVIIIPTSGYKDRSANAAFSRLVVRSLSRAGASRQPVPSLLSLNPSFDPNPTGVGAGNAGFLDYVFLEAIYHPEIPYRALAADVVSKIVEIVEFELSKHRRS